MPVQTLPAPYPPVPTKIALVSDERTVRVGMRPTEAFAALRELQESGFEDERLPSGFAAPYRARSRETASGGFGVISYRDQVVAAMHQELKVSYERVQEVLESHRKHMGREADQQVAGSRVNYWFWEEDNQRLMILAFRKDPSDGVQLTVAMGDRTVMDALKASPTLAEIERDRVDRILSERDNVQNRTPVRKG
jgi:hypothetical protein